MTDAGGTVDGVAQPGRPDLPASDIPVGRRAFLGFTLLGLLSLFVGRDLVPSVQLGRLKPGAPRDFRINSVAPAPGFLAATWRLTLEGLFRKPDRLTYTEFIATLPHVEQTHDFHCEEGWKVENVRWKGVRLREILRRGDIDPTATHVVFHSGDGVYSDSLTIKEALRNTSLLAVEMAGQPLTQDMGYPLRLVVPGSYGYKWVKWVERVEAIRADSYSGYWEQRGYPEDGTIK